jgi:hypothetical protein
VRDSGHVLFKSIIRQSLLLSHRFEPTNSHFTTSFEIADVGLYVKERCAVEDIDIFDEQLVFHDGDEPHHG